MSFTKITGPGISSYPVIVGIITALNFKSGTTNIHNVGVEAAGINVLGGDTPIGTGATITVDPPPSSSGAYTQYTDIVVQDTADLIIGDGDDLIPDVLGLSTETATVYSATGGRIRAGTFTNAGANGAPTATNGWIVTGVCTATTFKGNLTGNVTGTASQLETNATGANLTLSGNLGVGGTITYEDVARVDATGISTFREGLKIGPLAGIALTAYTDGSIRTSGIITANTYYGSGANLTGIDATQIVTGNTSVQTVDTGSDGHIKINTEGSERIRIGPAGQFGIGGATYGSSGQVLTSGGASAAPSWAAAGGVTYIDQWHYTTNQDLSSQDPLTGWTHSTHAANARLGTAMTESSGTWSFPATGMWLVSFSCWYYADSRSSRWMQSRINTTENNSSYNQASAASNAIYNTGANGYNSAYSQFIFDVTNTTNCKVRFSVDSQATLQYMGGRNFTAVKFIRLCGT